MKYARKCSVTGEGMNEGWCWGDGAFYTKHQKDTSDELRKDFPDMAHLTNDQLLVWAIEEEGALYYTEWNKNNPEGKLSRKAEFTSNY